jgi:hypothetical protein
MVKNLIIIGAGGFGREMFAAAREAVGYGEDFVIKGFLDGNPDALRGYAGYPAIIGTPETYEISDDDVFITALGSISARRRCAAICALSFSARVRRVKSSMAWSLFSREQSAILT